MKKQLIDKDYKVFPITDFIKLNGAKWQLSVVLGNPGKFGIYILTNLAEHPLKGVRLEWAIKDINNELTYLNPSIYKYRMIANQALIEPEEAMLYAKSQQIMKRKSQWYWDGEDYICYFERVDEEDIDLLEALQANYPTTFKFEEFDKIEG